MEVPQTDCCSASAELTRRPLWRPLPFLSFPHGRGGGSALSLPLSWVVNSLFSQTSLSRQLSEDAGTQSGIDGQVFVAMPCYKCSHDRICMVSKIQQYGWTHNFKRIKHCMGFKDSSLRPPLHGLISEVRANQEKRWSSPSSG